MEVFSSQPLLSAFSASVCSSGPPNTHPRDLFLVANVGNQLFNGFDNTPNVFVLIDYNILLWFEVGTIQSLL